MLKISNSILSLDVVYYDTQRLHNWLKTAGLLNLEAKIVDVAEYSSEDIKKQESQ